MAPVRVQVDLALKRAAATDLAVVAGSCEDILEHQSGDQFAVATKPELVR